MFIMRLLVHSYQYVVMCDLSFFFFSSRRRHTRSLCDWSSDVCSSDLPAARHLRREGPEHPAGGREEVRRRTHDREKGAQVLLLRRRARLRESEQPALRREERGGSVGEGAGLPRRALEGREGRREIVQLVRTGFQTTTS